MSLRARLVVALLALFAAGMTVYGVATYRAFASSELARLDEQVRGSLTIVQRELRLAAVRGPMGPDDGGSDGSGDGPSRRQGPDMPRVVVSPGTYAEVRDADGTVLESIQIADDPQRPDLSGIDPRVTDVVGGGAADDRTLWTVPSADGAMAWRVAARGFPSGHVLLVAVPMGSVEQALDRLLTIELVAGTLLLAVLGIGAWLVLRAGLRPLERIAVATRTITAGNLDQRVPTPEANTEIRELAIALNAMLEDLEGAFRERAATEAKLRRFLSDASHELRTPLTSIQGYAELFRLGQGSDDVDLPVIMRRIESESDRMRQLVENLLALARLDEAGTPTREPVDLAVLAADACSDAAARDPERPITLDAATPVPVDGDPSHLRQAIGNLVANALRHTPPGTPITVAAHLAEADPAGAGAAGVVAIVEVRDRGPGVAPEALGRVFDRFWQADPSRVGAGTGLGLSIVQAVATEHGGTVDAANAPEGGAVFTLRLPATAPTRHVAAPVTDPTGSAPAAGQNHETPHGR